MPSASSTARMLARASQLRDGRRFDGTRPNLSYLKMQYALVLLLVAKYPNDQPRAALASCSSWGVISRIAECSLKFLQVVAILLKYLA